MLVRDIELSHYVIDPNKFRLRKVVRVLALVFLFIRNLKRKVNINLHYTVVSENELPIQFKNFNDKYLITQEKNSLNAFPFDCVKGLVVTLNDELLITALNYLYKKATLEITALNYLYKKATLEITALNYLYKKAPLEIKQLLPKMVYQRIS